MTPEQHNKYLALAHLVYGGIYCLLMLFMVLAFGLMAAAASVGSNAKDAPPPMIFAVMFTFMGLFYGALIIPSFVAGYALLKRKRWAKVSAIIAAVMAAMFFPIGTAVCVYTFWFLFSDPGKALFDTPAYTPRLPFRERLGDLPNKKPKEQYVPPATPPDWR
jgi:fructose-specific phosphotransferase system IIC component